MRSTRTLTLVALVLMLTGACGVPRQLRQSIASDTRLDVVDSMARALIGSGFNAGSVYHQVWCRDLNTFIETSCELLPRETIREAVVRFYAFQQPNGEMLDGYMEADKVPYKPVYYSELAPGWIGYKNTVETDQESSLIQLTSKYIEKTGDRSVLQEKVGDQTVLERMRRMVEYLTTEKFSPEYGLITGATTIDWGDVQPLTDNLVRIDEHSKTAIDIYDNAMLLIALERLAAMDPAQAGRWKQLHRAIFANVRKHLWDSRSQKFIPHIYLDGSPFGDDFDENEICYHGGTAVAIEAGLLSRAEIKAVNRRMLEDVKASGMATIGVTVYPVYPEGYFHHGHSRPYYYQNGGDWTWFGGRMIKQLILNGFIEEAYAEFSPMLDRAIENDGFFEWYGPGNKPNGSGAYRGTAGVMAEVIALLKGLE